MSRAFMKVLKAYGAPLTRDNYLNTAWAGRPPVDENGDLDPELEAELPVQFQRSAFMKFPAIGVGRCGLCGSDGLLYDAGGVLYCERCEHGFLETTRKYATDDGYVFFGLNDGSLSDGDLKYLTLAALRQEHDVTLVED